MNCVCAVLHSDQCGNHLQLALVGHESLISSLFSALGLICLPLVKPADRPGCQLVTAKRARLLLLLRRTLVRLGAVVLARARRADRDGERGAVRAGRRRHPLAQEVRHPRRLRAFRAAGRWQGRVGTGVARLRLRLRGGVDLQYRVRALLDDAQVPGEG